jgi:hypothetical protein
MIKQLARWILSKEIAHTQRTHNSHVRKLDMRIVMYTNWVNSKNIEIAGLRETVKNAYFDGWEDGRSTCTVTGDPTIDWNSSETKAALDASDA